MTKNKNIKIPFITITVLQLNVSLADQKASYSFISNLKI